MEEQVEERSVVDCVVMGVVEEARELLRDEVSTKQ